MNQGQSSSRSLYVYRLVTVFFAQKLILKFQSHLMLLNYCHSVRAGDIRHRPVLVAVTHSISWNQNGNNSLMKIQYGNQYQLRYSRELAHLYSMVM